MTWADWIPTLVSTSALAILGWLLRVPLQKGIERAISNVFDEKLEKFKSELRRDEEMLRAELQLRGAEIDALRSGAFTNFASRQAELGRRRILAIERVWAEVIELNKYRHLSSFAQTFNVESMIEISADSIERRKIGEFASLLLGDLANTKTQQYEGLASKERPFIPELTFALFTSYRSIIIWPYLLLQSMRLQGDLKLLKTESVVEIASKALPHQKAFLDEHGIGGVPFLVEELEAAVLTSLREALEQKDADDAALAQARAINQAVSASAVKSVPAQVPEFIK